MMKRIGAVLAGVTLGLVPLVVSETGAVSAAADACGQRLDADARRVYRYRLTPNSTSTIPFASVYVTPTAVNPHWYCVRVNTEGREVWHGWGAAEAPRRNGSCGRYGEFGSEPWVDSGFAAEMRVAKHTCLIHTYSMKWQGRWYEASFTRVRD